MKRRIGLKLNFGRLALTFLLLCLIIYTCYHALMGTSGSLLTTPAKTVSDIRLVGGDAWLFRDETLLTAPEVGLVNSVAVSGSKVGKNTVLTQIWVDETQASVEEKQKQLDRLNHTIAILEAGLLPEKTPLSKADGYRAEALETVGKIELAIRSGDWSSLSELESELLISLNRYGGLMGKAEELQQTLELVRAERDALLTGTVLELVNRESSAYYYGLSQVDGYETVFTEEALNALTPESFEALKQTKAEDGMSFVVGKLCYGYSWRVAVEFSDACADLFETEGVYSVKFPENDGVELEMVCEGLMETVGGGTVAILRSDVTPMEFRYLRVQKAEITVGSMEGIYIPVQSYVTQNGMDGVYVFEGSTVRFRRIRVRYRDEGYLIADLQDAEPEHPVAYLSLNDLIITSGKNLYDGKVYQ